MLLIPPRFPIDRTFPAPGTHLCGMASDGARLWHSDADTERIYQIDTATGRVVAEIPCPGVRTDLAFDGRHLWQIAGQPKRIVVMDPADGRSVTEISLGPDGENACGLHVEGDRYWIGWKGEASIEERNLVSHEVLATHGATPRIAGLTKRLDALWFTDFEEGLLVGMDLPSGVEIARFQLDGNPTGLCWDGEGFWYSDYLGRRLCRLRLAWD